MNPKAIPIEIAVICLIFYLVFKIIKWMARAITARDRVVELEKENATLKADLETLSSPDVGREYFNTTGLGTWRTTDGKRCSNCGRALIDHVNQQYCPKDTRTDLTTKRTRRPQVGDDIKP